MNMAPSRQASHDEEFRFYTEDTCALKSDLAHIGVIDRTFYDVLTHEEDPLSIYAEIEKGRGIRGRDYRAFLQSGIPPRGAVLFTSAQTPQRWNNGSILIRESDLTLIDRALLVGDVVKRSPRDAASGTVIQSRTSASLIPPEPWPEPARSYAEATGFRDARGNYSSNAQDVIHNVSAADLTIPSGTDSEGFVIYKEWVGKIFATEEEISIRLCNGSVVIVEDNADLEFPESNNYCEVNDFVLTKKANLRRGRWVFGAYDPNIEPRGYVADVRITGLSVEWIFQAGDITGISQPPRQYIDIDMLESGDYHFCNRKRRVKDDAAVVGTEKNSIRSEIGSDVSVGDRVRFHKNATGSSHQNGTVSDPDRVPQRIPRSEALGYDINVYLVAKTETEVTVLWQDLSTSVLKSAELVPHVDLDNEEEAWPGELVVTRNHNEHFDSDDEQIGIVQTVNAAERMARIRWFQGTYVTLTLDNSTLLHATYGTLNTRIDDVSLYDVYTIASLSRRIGDFVCLDDSLFFYGHQRDARERFGEIVSLGLDGRLTVRLCGLDDVPEVEIPWRNAILVHSPDMAEDDDEEQYYDAEEDAEEDEDYDAEEQEEEEQEDWEYETDTGSEISEGGTRTSRNAKLLKPKKHDESSSADDEDDEWQTEDESSLSEQSDEDRDGSNISSRETQIVATTKPDTDKSGSKQSAFSSDFSYKAMFSNSIKPDAFTILETLPPADHHYFHRTSPNQGAKRLKRIQKEYSILSSSLPDGVFVRTWEGALDLMRILILGPIDTPYEYAPFVIDLLLDDTFPISPPKVHFHSWTDNNGAVNPNLYEDGTICLSLLGTWHSDKSSEFWSPESTILQVIVSLLGLVLVQEPYFNEAGYEVRRGSVESQVPSALYSERAYLLSRKFIVHALNRPLGGIADLLQQIYVTKEDHAPRLLIHSINTAVMLARRSTANGLGGPGKLEEKDKQGRKISAGAVTRLKREIEALLHVLKRSEEGIAQEMAMDILGVPLS